MISLLALSVAATTSVLFLSGVMSGPVRAGTLAVAFGGLGATLANPRWRATLTMRGVMTASVAITAVAVVAPPAESRDVWSYAFYGRTVVEYGENPYATVPDDHPDDPYHELVGSGWRDAPSVYGPVFTGMSIGIMGVAGTNEHVARVLFQLVAAAAALGILLLIARETRSPAAVVALGLNPLMIYSVINSAHNDVLIGLCVLGGALLATRGRDVPAALVLAAAALVKVSAVLALPALVLWIWYRRGLGRAAAAAGAAAATLGVGFALAGGADAWRPLSRASAQLSRGSIWQIVRPGAWGRLFSFAQRAAEPLPSTTAKVAIVATAVFALWLAYTRRRDTTPALALGAALTAYLLTAAYVLPWYAAWALPVLALRWRAGLSVLVAVQAALWAVAYQYERGLPLSPANRILWLLAAATIAFNLAAIAALAASGWRRERDARRSERAVRIATEELSA